MPPASAATDEAFWREVRKAFPPHPDYINLENGYSSPQPMPTWDAFQRHEQAVNNGLSFYMRRRRAADYASVKQQLAALAGCPADEIAITRNTTESLGTVIHGIDLEPGAEAVMCDQDYGTMLEQFRQQARRRGLTCVEISVPLHPRDDQEMVDTYARAITPRTKLLLLSHMINITGQILPVRKIADMAHARGVAVIVDAAHSFAQLVFGVPDLDGDYLGASLHKWLCTPLGAGLLHVKKEKIRTVWPLLRRDERARGRHQEAGADRDASRVDGHGDCRRDQVPQPGRRRAQGGPPALPAAGTWTDRVRDIPKVYLNTPSGSRACAIANVGITGWTPGALADALFDRHRIYTVAIDTVPVKGVRVTPHLYTTTTELDALVKAIGDLARA